MCKFSLHKLCHINIELQILDECADWFEKIGINCLKKIKHFIIYLASHIRVSKQFRLNTSQLSQSITRYLTTIHHKPTGDVKLRHAGSICQICVKSSEPFKKLSSINKPNINVIFASQFSIFKFQPHPHQFNVTDCQSKSHFHQWRKK